jgi:hypothetical protein
MIWTLLKKDFNSPPPLERERKTYGWGNRHPLRIIACPTTRCSRCTSGRATETMASA